MQMGSKRKLVFSDHALGWYKHSPGVNKEKGHPSPPASTRVVLMPTLRGIQGEKSPEALGALDKQAL